MRNTPSHVRSTAASPGPPCTPSALARAASVAALSLLLAACASDSAPDALPSGASSVPSSNAASNGATDTATGNASSSPTDDVTRLAVAVTEGRVNPPVRRVKLSVGDRVRMRVVADVADEVHVHGADKSVKIEPGIPAVVRFSMTEPGVYEVELEDAALPLVQLEVR